MANTAGTVAEGGAVDLETYDWAYRGARTTAEEAGYEAQKEPKAQLDNDWNFSTRIDAKLMNWQIGENERNISDLESRLSELESTVADLETRYNSHNHDDRYYTEMEADNRFLTETEADGLYYPRTEADNTFLTESEAKALFYTQGQTEDRYLNTTGDRSTGEQIVEPAATSGEADASHVLHSHADGEAHYGYAHDDVLEWRTSTGASFPDPNAGFSWAVRSKRSEIDVIKATHAGGVSISGAAGSTLDASGVDAIEIPEHTGSDPAVSGGTFIWSRPDAA